MGLKVKLLPSLFKVPSCTQKPKTSSFRLTTSMKNDIFKTINSVYFDQESDIVETPDSWFTNSSAELDNDTVSLSDDNNESSQSGEDTHLESIIRGAQLSSSADHRLKFDASAEDSPKLGPTFGRTLPDRSNVRSLIPKNTSINKSGSAPFKESVAMSMDSEDPYEDFKRSMDEMVESLEVRDDWEGLEELLGWYLKVNGRKYHGYIISAFIDLLVGDFGNNTYSSDESSSSTRDVIGTDKINTVISRDSFCSATSSLVSSYSSISDHINGCT